MNLILASSSPRRRELMKLITDEFKSVSTDMDETLTDDITPENASLYLSEIKAAAVVKDFPDDIIIGCDTTVIFNDMILGKPADKEQCRKYIEMLSGNTHKVITGCTLIRGSERRSFSVATNVTFRNLSKSEIEEYILSDEPYDKAGGYAIQGKGALLIEKIDGDYFNVVGLPVSELNVELKKFKEDIMNSTAFSPADILIPDTADMSKWAVIACDQYTSEPEYWNSVYETVGDAPSSLNLILPEIYLENDDVESRISAIHDNMNAYVKNHIFKEYKDSVIYVERTQSNGIIRRGLIGKIDLEEYDFSKGSTSSVRATEATVIQRIPPRIKVRRGAALELPHIMILIDDSQNTVIEPLADKTDKFEKVYDTKLMQGGGSIKGWVVEKIFWSEINSALCKLADRDSFNEKYNLTDSPVLLYAMGDGNHSLATAKEFYEQLKRENPDKDMTSHPARYALVEIVNLHSPALEFEAIHRLVFDVDCESLIKEMTSELGLTETGNGQYFTYVYNNTEKTVYINKPSSNLSVGSLQNFIDAYLSKNGGKIDYIHGAETVKSLAEKHNGIAFILPDMNKSQLFPTVIKDGALPRKTFSMGHAADKRYYIETRRITE